MSKHAAKLAVSFYLTVYLMLLPAVAAAVTFIDIWEYRVDGVESIDPEALQRALSPYLGAARTIQDVDKAAGAVQQLYRQAGYPATAVSVPEQDVVGGVIRLQVEEARVRRVRVAGSRYFSLEGIRQRFPSLSSGQVLDINALQADVQKSNQLNRDLKVVPSLKAGPVPGTVDVDLNVADEFPLHGGIEMTNYHTENTTDMRVSADLRYGNLWQRHHEASLQMQITPEDTEEVNVLAASYLFPFGDKGAKLAAYAVLSDSELAAINDINVIGEGQIFGFRWVQPISQSKSAVHSISTGIDYKDFDEDLVFAGGEVRQTPVSYTTFSAQYNLFHRSGNITDSFSTGFSFGSRLLNDSEEFNEKKSQAGASFGIWKFDWTRNYQLPRQWRFSHRLRGQISESPLVNNEQMSAGGITSVRGYFESQIQGDYGFIGRLELATPPLAGDWRLLSGLSGHFFYDAAKVYLNEALADQAGNIFIDSVGLGLKATVADQWNIKLDGGLALKDEGEVSKNTFRARASWRFEF